MYAMVAAGTIPPVAENTRGVKEPCSISRMRCSYALRFRVSWCLYVEAREDLQLLGARGLKTLMSKNALCCLTPQNPCARTSRRASSPEIDVLCESLSPVSGCSVGSIATFEQTSVISFAVRSLTSLCRMEGSPPQGQLKACSVEKVEPQTQ